MCALVTGVQTCALPISAPFAVLAALGLDPAVAAARLRVVVVAMARPSSIAPRSGAAGPRPNRGQSTPTRVYRQLQPDESCRLWPASHRLAGTGWRGTGWRAIGRAHVWTPVTNEHTVRRL